MKNYSKWRVPTNQVPVVFEGKACLMVPFITEQEQQRRSRLRLMVSADHCLKINLFKMMRKG